MKTEHNQEETVTISMFGSLELTYGSQILTESTNRSRKMWNLLSYLITYRKKNITQAEFIDVLWPDGESSNPINALKTLLYRIRILLNPLCIGQTAFILSSRNSYCWNNAIDCMIDVELFDEYLQKASDQDTNTQTRIELYQKALALYKGDFLSKHSNELWVIPISTHYHSLYMDSVKCLLTLLERQGSYEEMEICCTKALQIDNMEESIHIQLIRTMLLRGNYTAALNHYEVTTTILFKSLGVKPSDTLRSLYQEIMKIQKSMETDLDVIQNDLMEAGYRPGAFVCDYGIFQELYRLSSRNPSREEHSMFLSLITVTLANGDIPDVDILNPVMDHLLSSITCCLRKGDVVTRYSSAQYLFLLSAVTLDTCNMILERITDHYHSHNTHFNIRIQYKMEKVIFQDQ